MTYMIVHPCCPDALKDNTKVDVVSVDMGNSFKGTLSKVREWGLFNEDGTQQKFCPHCGEKHQILGIREANEAESKSKMVYLACPYSHKSIEVMEDRKHLAAAAAFLLVSDGFVVFSPITQSAAMLELTGQADEGWEFWSGCDLGMVERSDALVVLTLDGWRDSFGVKQEIAKAESLGLPVVYWDGEKEFAIPEEEE